MDKIRKYLCVGCHNAPDDFDGSQSHLECTAAKATIPAIPYAKGMRFEGCSHRNMARATAQELIALARHARIRGTAELNKSFP